MGYGGKQAIRSGDIRRFNFTGNGSNTAFDLGFTPASQNQLIITVNGLVQHYDAFSVSGSTITFTGTPASGDTIQVTAVVDAVGIASIPDGAIANVATLTVSGNSSHTGAATFSNTVAITGTANVSQTLTTNTLVTTTNTATFGTAVYHVANGSIGIGTSSPSSKIHVVESTSTTSDSIRVSNIANTYSQAGISFYTTAQTSSTEVLTARLYALYTSSGFGNQQLRLQTGDGAGNLQDRLLINANGHITMSYQPAFQAGTSGSAVTFGTNVKIDCLTTATLNRGSHYNAASSRFVAPVAGVYFFSGCLVDTNGTDGSWVFKKNGSDIYGGADATMVYTTNLGTGIHTALTATCMVQLAASDYVELYTRNYSLNINGNHSWWNGYLVG